jgi:hypothetical protein
VSVEGGSSDGQNGLLRNTAKKGQGTFLWKQTTKESDV